MPKALPAFCTGCQRCFAEGEDKCPHSAFTLPLLRAMLEADLLVFTSPVYAFHLSGAMKSFLDHWSFMFMVHRPQREMFTKQAILIAASAGSPPGETLGAMADSLAL